MASPRNSSYSYTSTNTLKHHISLMKNIRVAESGNHVLIRDIEEELAEYCEITRDSVLMIKRGVNQPALAVALKMSTYFKVPVEEIFQLANKSDVVKKKVYKTNEEV